MPYYMKSKRIKGEQRQISREDYLRLKDKTPFTNNWEFIETPDATPLIGVSADELINEFNPTEEPRAETESSILIKDLKRNAINAINERLNKAKSNKSAQIELPKEDEQPKQRKPKKPKTE